VTIIGRLFGSRRHANREPTPDEVADVDLDRMIAIARERGDRRSDPEVVASLVIGAEVTAERHHDADMRARAVAASVAATRWLVASEGEEEAARLLSTSDGPVDEAGQARRP
jgi:hypothetical protein